MLTRKWLPFGAAGIAVSIFAITIGFGADLAGAQDQPAPTTTPVWEASDDDHVVVEHFTLGGDRISTEAFDKGGDSVPVPVNFESRDIITMTDGLTQSSSSGTGGSSSANGCTRVTVRNEKETLLGFTAFWFNTWTYWCWNRNSKIVSSVQTGWYLSDVDPLFIWRSMIVDHTEHYPWVQGFPRSGYVHEKQGHVENCLGHYGCIGSLYPRNQLRSHSNGTWSWHTQD